MLNKAIYFNYKLVESEFLACIFMTIFILICSVLSIGGLVIAGVLSIVIAIVNINIYRKLFRVSLFADEASVYMSVPITEKNMILGKTTVVCVLQVICGMISIVGVVIAYKITGADLFDGTLMENLFGEIGSADLPPIEGAIIGFLYLAQQGLVVLVSALFILVVQIIFYQSSGRRDNKVMPVVLIIVCFLIASALEEGAQWLTNYLSGMGIDYLLLYFVFTAVKIGIVIVLYKLCVKKFAKSIDFM